MVYGCSLGKNYECKKMILLSLNALLVLLWNVNRQNQIKLSFSPSINLQPAGLNWAYLHYTYVIGNIFNFIEHKKL